MKILLAVVLSGVLASCASNQQEEKVEPTVVKNVVRVLMHSTGDYTFLVRTGSNKIGQLRIIMRWEYDQNVEMVEDVAEHQNSWIEYNCSFDCKNVPAAFSYLQDGSVKKLVMHLHSIKEINGAGWTNTSGGLPPFIGGHTERGQTVVIE